MPFDTPPRATTERPLIHESQDSADVRIRPLASIEEYRAAVALQIDTWGEESADIVPASLMQVAARVGGLAIGAFTDDDVLVGFAFGLDGVYAAERVHWSHMLAVHREARGGGIGRRIKEYQRAELARRGVGRLYWTFDPLQARNAHLNLNRLGVRVIEYVVNMYGASPSRLHHGMETDRLIVTSPTSATAPAKRPLEALADPIPILTPFPKPGDLRLDVGAATVPTTALIEIPADLEELVGRSPAAAAEWRLATRQHFQWALRHRCDIAGLRRDPVATRAFYVMTSTTANTPTNTATSTARPQPSI